MLSQYIVTGRGYTFTRHNNKLTMNIDTEVFFDDKTTPAESGLKKKPSSPKQPPNKYELIPVATTIDEYILHHIDFHCRSNLRRGTFHLQIFILV